MRVPIDFVGEAYELPSKDASAQRCVNFYPVPTGAGRGRMALYGTPGLAGWTGEGDGPCRGLFATEDYLFFVSGTTLFQITSNTVVVNSWTMPGSANVSMAYNGTQLMIVNGTQGYIWTKATGALAQITDPDFPGATHVTYQDGYFIFNSPNTGSFMITAINDGTSVDALDIASAESHPDNIVALISVQRKLLVLGDRSGELFYNSGNAAFPFERIGDAVSDIGCAAPFSLAKVDGSALWLGRSQSGGLHVVSQGGYFPKIISTPAIDHAINNYATVSDATATVIDLGDHLFYDLSFPTAGTTWSYNVRTKMWNEKSSFGVGRHRAQFSAHFDNKQLVGDYTTPQVNQISKTAYTDADTTILSIRDSAPLFMDGRRIVVKGLHIDIEAGVGLATGQGSDPQMMLAVSRDGGHSFEDEVQMSMGAVGGYSATASRYNLGESREWVFRISISDPVKRVILGAYADIEVSKY